MITEKQREKNEEEDKIFDDLIQQQKERFEKLYEFDINSAFEYKCSETTADDWTETHETTAQLIIQLQRHAKKVAEHLVVLANLETVESLRSYSMNRFDVSDEIYLEHLDNTVFCFSFRKLKDLEMISRVTQMTS